jgi:hypothetical protein
MQGEGFARVEFAGKVIEMRDPEARAYIAAQRVPSVDLFLSQAGGIWVRE